MAAPNHSEGGVQIFYRIRPVNNTDDQWEWIEGEDTINIAGKLFEFDRMDKPKTMQDQILPSCHIAKDVLDGYNGAVFAYGQPELGAPRMLAREFGYPGIMDDVVQNLFNNMYTMDQNLEFAIKVSYYELCNEKIRDLLDVTKTDLSIREDSKGTPYVRGATKKYVSTPDEIMDSVEEGKNNRRIGVAFMAEHLSRSHTIFLIQVGQYNCATQQQLEGKLYFVDLTGMEMVSETRAQEEPELD